MVETSAKWKAAFDEMMMGEAFVEVSIDKSNRSLLANATVSTESGIMKQSNLESIVKSKTIEKYGTLEQNLWIMDGNSQWLSDDADVGFVSNALSDDQGAFESGSEPSFTILIPVVKTLQGLTITFSKSHNEWATEFDVEFLDANDTSILLKEVRENSKYNATILDSVTGCKKIIVTIKKWCLSGRRARVEDVIGGCIITFTKADMLKFFTEQTVSPVNSELPTAKLDFTIENYDGRYSANNKIDIGKFMEKQLSVSVRYGITLLDNTIEWIDGGTFILESWGFDDIGQSFHVSARDSLYFMTNNFYKLRFDESGYSLYDLAIAVLQDAALQYHVIGWNLDDGLKNINTISFAPEITHAELLQLIAQAAGMILSYTRYGIIKIAPPDYNESSSQGNIESMYCFEYPKYELHDKVGIINCNIYNYVNEKVSLDYSKFPNVTGCISEPVRNYITSQDYSAILSAAAKIGAGEATGFTPEQETKADVDMDGIITASDAAFMASFPVMAANGRYENSPSGWELYYNEKVGTKKIIAQSEIMLDSSETTQISINHTPSYDISFKTDVYLTNVIMRDYACFTVLTFPQGTGKVNITLYGYPIQKSNEISSKRIEEDNESEMGIDNPLITDENTAAISSTAVSNWIGNNVTFSLSNFRADPSFDVGIAKIDNTLVYITDFKMQFTGMFHGQIEGRVLS